MDKKHTNSKNNQEEDLGINLGNLKVGEVCYMYIRNRITGSTAVMSYEVTRLEGDKKFGIPMGVIGGIQEHDINNKEE